MAVGFMAQRVRFRNSCTGLLLVLAACQNGPQTAPQPQARVNAATVSGGWVNGSMQVNGRPFSGMLFTLAPGSADTQTIACFSNGREHGIWQQFYPGGRLMETRRYHNGQKTGDYTAWWPHGRKRLHYRFANNEYEGLCEEWNEDGMLIKAMNYKQGHEEGLQQWWYNNGKIKANYVVTGGRRYGLLGTKNCVNVTDSIFNK